MMKNPRAAVTICICGMLLVPSLAHGLGARQEQAVQPEGLRIVVIEGEDSVNIIGQGTAVATVVEVRDRNDLPVSGASVVFLLGEGGTATLNAGLSQVTLTTNALGQAAVTVNPVANGAVQLSVNATFQGQTATTAIVQTNFATAAQAAAAGASTGGGTGGGGGGGIGMGTVIGITGAAVGATVGVRAATAWSGRKVDRAVLVEFYNATNGANWSDNTNWKSDEPLDTWHGVTTDGGGRVTHLELPYNNLMGEVPDQSLNRDVPIVGLLKNLRVLDLSYNALSGRIPSALGNFVNLDVLNLDNNQLTGSIPSSLGSLTNLESLYLGNNQLTGSIPSWLGSLTNLQELYLSNNQLTGSIPAALCHFESSINPQQGGVDLPGCGADSDDRAVLVEFYNATNGANWSDNTNWNSSEPLDQWYGVDTDSNGRVTRLGLNNKQLTGSIPSSLGSLTNLQSLWLNNNQLTGSIPAALCRFEGAINPQQGDVDLPCSESATVGALEARLVPGDGQLTVDWTAPSGDGAPIDDYDVRYRADAETGAWTELADATESAAPSATITGLTNGTAYQVQVRAGDGEWSATVTGTPAAPAERLTFGEARIEDQRYRQHAAIAPLVLPAATGGEGAVTYALSPALPAGLLFDAATRTLSGAPSVATAASTYTYTATDGAASPAQASLSFTIEVEVSAEEAALRRDALAAQGRALLSSVTGVIGERFRPRSSPAGGEGTRGAAEALGEALASMFGSWSSQGRVGGAGGAAFARGVGPAGHAARVGGGLDGLSGVGGAGGFVGSSAAGSDIGLGGLWASGAGRFDGALPGMRPGSPGIGGGGWDGGLWGRSFAAPLAAGEDGVGASRYTVWGAGDRQSFSGAPEQGRYSGDVRSFYVGADRRLGTDWLAGAAVGRSWGAADYAANAAGATEGRLTTRLTSLYPYVRGAVSSGLELWAIGGYGRGEAGDARGMEALGAPGELTMTMGAAGLRQDVAERGGVALAVVGGAGSLSLSTAGGGLTLAGLSAGVHQARVAVEASRASGAVSPFVQVGGRYDGGDGQTGGGWRWWRVCGRRPRGSIWRRAAGGCRCTRRRGTRSTGPRSAWP